MLVHQGNNGRAGDMTVDLVRDPLRFAERVERLLGKVEFRVAKRPSEREAVFRLRYDAYRRRNLLNSYVEGLLYDEVYDESPNGCSTMTFIEGEFASTVRVHVSADEDADLPSMRVFADVILPHLQGGEIVVDPTRLAARLDLSRLYPELPYFALRPVWMAAQHFNADFVIATTSIEHASFYRRVCGYESWSEPRTYPCMTFDVLCLGLDFQARRQRVEARYPSFGATRAECMALYGAMPLLSGRASRRSIRRDAVNLGDLATAAA